MEDNDDEVSCIRRFACILVDIRPADQQRSFVSDMHLCFSASYKFVLNMPHCRRQHSAVPRVVHCLDESHGTSSTTSQILVESTQKENMSL